MCAVPEEHNGLVYLVALGMSEGVNQYIVEGCSEARARKEKIYG